jgi:formate hydrogenlyase subunit 3/multisubunit Na+/H+ antiporter MnhD subunit
MIVANLFAIGEDNLKRRLAYSTINQLSFIILGVALLSPMSVTGAMIHIPFHGFMKITLFLCAGAMIAITGKTEVSQMAGIARQIPVTMKAFTIGAFGMCGIPPIAGFISKWYICLGSVQAGMIPFVFVAVIASLLDVVYFFPIIRTAFFEKPLETNGGEREVRNKETEQPIYLFMVIPLAITAIFSIVFCLFPNSFHIFDLAQMAVRNIFGGV